MNINPGAIAGGSGGQYFVGTFDGTRFVSDDPTPPLAAPPGEEVLTYFDDPTYGEWVTTGDAWGAGPTFSTFEGKRRVASSAVGGLDAKGTLTSPAFRLSRPYLVFLVGGGNSPAERVRLRVDGAVVATTSGLQGDALDWVSWDVRKYAGREATLELVDDGGGPYGYLVVDHVAQSDVPARTSADRARWLDYGKDYYAAVSFGNLPSKDGRRLMIGWMNDWEYGQDIPTSPWRSAQSIVREIRLRRYDDGLHLVQAPVVELTRIRGRRITLGRRPVASTRGPIGAGFSGRALEIVAVFEPGAASELGLAVRTGDGEQTLIGYDVAAGRVFVDRTRSGRSDFDIRFAGRHSAPLSLESGRVKLHVLVDWSSVELFANDGRVSVTDQIFPKPSSDGVALYAVGGTARLVSLDAWPLRSAWGRAD